jgi:putative hydrolase of the HAD superfamily
VIRALIFDMGNVLVYFSHERMCRQIGELVGRSGDEVRRELMESGLFTRYETGQITAEAVHSHVESIVSKAIDRRALERAASDIFWRNETIEPVIDSLATLGLPLILLSNTCDAHIRWIDDRFPVLRHFTRRVLSFEIGAAKPDRPIFEAAARAAGVAPAECFFADDTPGHIDAAQRLGFDAVVYRDTPQLTSELRTRGFLLA